MKEKNINDVQQGGGYLNNEQYLMGIWSENNIDWNRFILTTCPYGYFKTIIYLWAII